MNRKSMAGAGLAGAAAGALNGFFGGGGGTVLVPLLEKLTDLPQQALFPCAIHMMVPICLLSLLLTSGPLPWERAAPYLLGSLLGGILAQRLKNKLPVLWLHRGLGLLILVGGVKML